MFIHIFSFLIHLYYLSLVFCFLFFSVVDDKIVLVASRQLLSDLCATYLKHLSAKQAKEIALYALERIAVRAISFEDQVGLYRNFLADQYEREENWREAAKILCGTPLESSQKYKMILFFSAGENLSFLLLLDLYQLIINCKLIYALRDSILKMMIQFKQKFLLIEHLSYKLKHAMKNYKFFTEYENLLMKILKFAFVTIL